MVEGSLRALAAPSHNAWRTNYGRRTGRAAQRAGIGTMDVNWRLTGTRFSLRRLKVVGSRRMKALEMVVTKSVDARGSELPTDGSRDDAQGIKWISSFHSTMNKASKWLVVLLVSGGMIWRHDEHALWFAIGSIVNGAVGKALKSLINENRPLSAAGVKKDPGMPSSHALGFAYLGSYTSVSCSNIWTILCGSGLILGSAYLSWLRICEGLHTVPQVLVGSALGGVTSLLWLTIWKSCVEATVETSPSLRLILYMAFLSACVFGYTSYLRRWKLGEP